MQHPPCSNHAAVVDETSPRSRPEAPWYERGSNTAVVTRYRRASSLWNRGSSRKSGYCSYIFRNDRGYRYFTSNHASSPPLSNSVMITVMKFAANRTSFPRNACENSYKAPRVAREERQAAKRAARAEDPMGYLYPFATTRSAPHPSKAGVDVRCGEAICRRVPKFRKIETRFPASLKKFTDLSDPFSYRRQRKKSLGSILRVYCCASSPILRLEVMFKAHVAGPRRDLERDQIIRSTFLNASIVYKTVQLYIRIPSGTY